MPRLHLRPFVWAIACLWQKPTDSALSCTHLVRQEGAPNWPTGQEHHPHDDTIRDVCAGLGLARLQQEPAIVDEGRTQLPQQKAGTCTCERE
jgi:hypothetical protein